MRLTTGVGALARAGWRRLPVVVRAVITGLFVLQAGNALTGVFVLGNLRVLPSVPWSAPCVAAVLWILWRYLRGSGWPASTSAVRRTRLRANPVSLHLWKWAMLTGCLGLGASFALQWALGRLSPLGYGIPSMFAAVPSATAVTLLATVSVSAGVVEEAAFRGYMQSQIEERHGFGVALVVASAVFGAVHLTDLQPAMTVTRMTFVVLAALVYGTLARWTNSIVPGVVIHSVGNVFGFGLIWLSSWQGRSRGTTAASGEVVADPAFWVIALVGAACAGGTALALRRLARAAREASTPPRTYRPERPVI